MANIILLVLFCGIATIGIASVFWARRGMSGVTDALILKLFQYTIALIITSMALSLAFVAWIFISTELTDKGATTMASYIFLVAILALISGTALAAKKIGDVYGFKVPDKKKAR